MPYTITHHRKNRYTEISFVPPVSVDEYFEAREKYIVSVDDETENRFLIDLSKLKFENFSAKDVIVEFCNSWNISLGRSIHIFLILPEDFDSQNEAYMMAHLSRMQGIDIQTFFADERQQAVTELGLL